MKFIIEKKALTRLLRVLGSDPKKKAHPSRLRLAAHDGQIILQAHDTEAGCEALILEEGVCFFRADQFLPLVRTCATAARLTIEATPRRPPNRHHQNHPPPLGNLPFPKPPHRPRKTGFRRPAQETGAARSASKSRGIQAGVGLRSGQSPRARAPDHSPHQHPADELPNSISRPIAGANRTVPHRRIHLRDALRRYVEQPPERRLEMIGEINVGRLQKLGRGYATPLELTVEPKPEDWNPAHAEIPQKITRGLANKIPPELKLHRPPAS